MYWKRSNKNRRYTFLHNSGRNGTAVDIKKELQARFNKPLQDNYQRRIIFWQDPDGEFSSQVDELSFDSVKILSGVSPRPSTAAQRICTAAYAILGSLISCPRQMTALSSLRLPAVR